MGTVDSGAGGHVSGMNDLADEQFVSLPAVSGTAQVIADPAAYQRMVAAIRRKYGIQFRIMLALEKVFSRHSRARVILRIFPAR